MWVMSELAGTFYNQECQAIRVGSLKEEAKEGSIGSSCFCVELTYLHVSAAKLVLVGLGCSEEGGRTRD